MNRTELKELICKGKKLKHKTLGLMKITEFQGNFFYADVKGGNMPFYYFEVGDTIEIVDAPKKAASISRPMATKVAKPAAKKVVK